MQATIERTITFEAAHRLRHHDGACRNIHGHSYKVEVMLTGEVKDNGMVLDFKALNDKLRELLFDEKEGWDHALLVSEDDPLLEIYKLLVEAGGLRMRYLPFEPTAENMARNVAERLGEWLPEHVTAIHVSVWETANSCATYGISLSPEGSVRV